MSLCCSQFKVAQGMEVEEEAGLILGTDLTPFLVITFL